MVNALKHKKLKSLRSHNISSDVDDRVNTFFDLNGFGDWLLHFFSNVSLENGLLRFMRYLGGINGAIQKATNNWNSINDVWDEHFLNNFICNNDTKSMLPLLLLAIYSEQHDTSSVIVLSNVMFRFFATADRVDLLLEKTKIFLNNKNVNALFVDCNDMDFNNMFSLFQVFEDAKKSDIIFLKNVSDAIFSFFIDFGIMECCSYCYFFSDESAFEWYVSQGVTEMGVVTLPQQLLYEKHNRVGFELYDNLKEWKKEITAPTRNDPEYIKMKKRVRQRDNNTCQCCGYHSNKKKNHNLEVHHIYGYKDHLDYRTEDSNCVVLCRDCHKQYHSLYGKKNVNPVTFMQFIRDYNDFHQKEIQSRLV